MLHSKSLVILEIPAKLCMKHKPKKISIASTHWCISHFEQELLGLRAVPEISSLIFITLLLIWSNCKGKSFAVLWGTWTCSWGKKARKQERIQDSRFPFCCLDFQILELLHINAFLLGAYFSLGLPRVLLGIPKTQHLCLMQSCRSHNMDTNSHICT